MISQGIFIFGLYIIGVYFGLLFKQKIPFVFIAITGFLWGALFWVIGGMLLLVTSIPYTLYSIAAYFIILFIIFSYLHARNNTWKLSPTELVQLLLVIVVFLLVLFVIGTFNFSSTSQDSIIMISSGRRIVFEGYSNEMISELSLRGIFLPQFQSASVFLGVDYLYLAQPTFALTFLLINLYLNQRILSHLLFEKWLRTVLSILISLVLFSTYFVVFQFFYIHNSMISAVYLFLAVSGFWLAMNEENYSWIVLSMISLLGFSLARNEAPLFSLLFLVPVISSGKIPYRDRLRNMLPYLIILILWYSYLLVRMGEGTKILDPEKTLLIIGSLFVFGFLVLISEAEWGQRIFFPHLPKILLGTLILILMMEFILKPNHMVLSVWIFIKNLLEAGGWGITWFVFIPLLLVSLVGPSVPEEDIFSYGITSYLVFLVAIVYFRNPYRLGWGDSANRMMTHILPLIILYVTMTIAWWSNESSVNRKVPVDLGSGE